MVQPSLLPLLLLLRFPIAAAAAAAANTASGYDYATLRLVSYPLRKPGAVQLMAADSAWDAFSGLGRLLTSW